MAITRAGLKAIFLTKYGQIEQSNPSYPFALGLRSAGELLFSPVNEVKDYRERSLRNMQKIKVTSSTFQAGLSDLKTFIEQYCADGKVDSQVVLVDKWSNGDNKLFQFEQEHALGFDFEYMISEKEKSCAITLEADLEYLQARTALDSAQVQTLNPWLANSNNGAGSAGIQFSKYSSQFLTQVKSPSGNDLFPKDSIVSRKLSLKTKGSKTAYGRTVVDYVTVSFEIVSRDATIEMYQGIMGRDQEAYLKLVEQTGVNKSETFEFQTGALTFSNEFKRGDSDAYSKVVYSADVPLGNITFDLSDSNNPKMTVTP